jgi:hypothetical protein
LHAEQQQQTGGDEKAKTVQGCLPVAGDQGVTRTGIASDAGKFCEIGSGTNGAMVVPQRLLLVSSTSVSGCADKSFNHYGRAETLNSCQKRSDL